MLLDPRAIHIYTDGSCYKNPGGNSGCAAIVHFPDRLGHEDERIVDFGCAESSNCMIRSRGSVPMAENMSAYFATRSLDLLGDIVGIFRHYQKYGLMSRDQGHYCPRAGLSLSQVWGLWHSIPP